MQRNQRIAVSLDSVLTGIDFHLYPVGYLFTDGFESGDVTSRSATTGTD